MAKPRRQAVVIIHGIGEQHPMETLRNFVVSVVGDGPHEALSKPDRISPTLELRRMAVPGKRNESGEYRISTDFYELYWAHLMAGTSWHHVIAWARTLMLCWPTRVPHRLLPFWLLTWVLLLGAAWIYWMWRPDLVQSAYAAAVVAAGVVTLRVFGLYFGLQYIGDAARYLSPTPPNIGVRHAIRSAALDLLRGLHDDPLRRYQRIVVVGHSLGGVIAYDALTYLWQERHHPSDHLMTPASQPAHDTLKDAHTRKAPEYRDLQSHIWREQRAIGVPWKITDFITLGSPLAHASFLMARSVKDFCERKRQREFPTCPPQEEDRRDEEYGENLLITSKGCKLLHHAALFACTRWTNLYFPGDLIGGPLQKLFGHWVADHRLQSRRLFGLGHLLPSSHIRYWKQSECTPPSVRETGSNPKTALEQLGKALDLDDWWTPENTAAAFAATATLMEDAMEDELKRLNVDMALEETNGNKTFFDDLLAPKFAFRRVSGAFDDREGFLAGLYAGGAERQCDPNSIEITPLGKMRAFVTCIVRMKIENEWKEFHNARLFVLDSKRWRLLGWANEEEKTE